MNKTFEEKRTLTAKQNYKHQVVKNLTTQVMVEHPLTSLTCVLCTKYKVEKQNQKFKNKYKIITVNFKYEFFFLLMVLKYVIMVILSDVSTIYAKTMSKT